MSTGLFNLIKLFFNRESELTMPKKPLFKKYTFKQKEKYAAAHPAKCAETQLKSSPAIKSVAVPDIPAEKPPLNVLFIISEADPLIKVGGLGDVGGTLPQALRALPASLTDGRKIDVRVAIPYHDKLKTDHVPAEWITNYQIPWRNSFQDVYLSKASNTEVPMYLVDGDPVRNCGIYNGNPYTDGYKYTFFPIAALELCRAINWHPDILHAHDWHTAAGIQKLSEIRPFDPIFKGTRSLYTIHNLPYSGGNYPDIFTDYDLHPAFNQDIPGWLRTLPMAIGLTSADQISTVSKTYAEEIQTVEFGHGYETYLSKNKDKLCGIVNGVTMDRWNPATDHILYQNFSAETLDQRINNKRMLQQEVGLPQRDNVPLFIMIGRMDAQKGIDLCLQALRNMRDRDWQTIILGTGNPQIENFCRSLANEYPDRVRSLIRFDAPLSRRMYAGGDILLMPSRYEPCGIAQMIAMLYGCVPVAHATGGLKDTITDPDQNADNFTGFLFQNADVHGTEWAMRRALDFYAKPEVWRQIQIRGMKQDFSWSISALKYYNLYKEILSRKII